MLADNASSRDPWDTGFVVVRSAQAPARLCAIGVVLVGWVECIVGSPVFEEPSQRGGREETKAKENNDRNQNAYSERNHAASLVFAVLCPATAAGQRTGTTD